MSLFKARQPRKYRPRVIFYDERKEKLRKLVNEVKRQQGEVVDEPYDPTKFKGTFSKFTPRAQKAKQRSRKLAWPVALMAIIVLIVIMRYLWTGKL